MHEIKQEIKELKQEIKEIHSAISGNTMALSKYNEQLEIHISASKDLNQRMVPLEDHVKFIRGLINLITKLLAGLAAIATVLKLWH